MRLSDREWREFLVDDLFTVYTGGDLILNQIKTGEIPVISHTSNNNGVSNWSEIIPGRKLFSHKTTISLADRGNFCAFVQNTDFYIGTRVKALEFKTTVSKFAMFFIAELINKQSVKFSYGRNACNNLNILKIMLPVNEENKPDWTFMEEYIKKLYERKKRQYSNYVKEVIKKLNYKDIPSLVEKKWKEFFLTEVFTKIQRGKRLTKANQTAGSMPYISSTASNNGVNNFISNKEKVRRFSDCLTIANSGSVGVSFYHPYEFVASDHVTHFKNNNMNKYIYLFIATITNRLSEKYNFNREINDKRISREKIVLPINDKDEPDYEYMEQYIKNLILEKYEIYKKGLDMLKE